MQRIRRLPEGDELLGEWHTEDGSGFMIIMGSWIKFQRDGSGTYKSWSNDEETGYSFKGDFNWTRIDEKSISIRDKNSGKSDLIEYEIKRVKGRDELSSKQEVTGTVRLDGFWNFAQVMFRWKN